MRCQVVCYAFVDVKAKGPECRCAGKEGRQGFDGGPNRRGTRGIRPAGRQGWRKGAGEGSYESRARGDRAESGGSTVGEEGLAGSCLSGCFSKPQPVVFAARPASARSTWYPARRPIAGLVGPSICPKSAPDPASAQPQCDRLTGVAKRRHTPPRVTAIYGGLLKQPDKQERASESPHTFGTKYACAISDAWSRKWGGSLTRISHRGLWERRFPLAEVSSWGGLDPDGIKRCPHSAWKLG